MRVRQFFIAVLILTLVGACNSHSNGKGSLVITLEATSFAGEAAPDLNKLSKTLQDRLVKFGFDEGDVTTALVGGRIQITLSHFSAYTEFSKQRIRKILQSSANLELWETYDVMEVINPLQEGEKALVTALGLDSLNGGADSLNEPNTKRKHPVLSLLMLNITQGHGGQQQLLPGPEVGRIRVRDTAAFMQYMRHPAMQSRLSSSLKLAWANDPNAQNGEALMRLIALKKTVSGKARISNPVITNAEVKVSEYGGGFVISASMDQPSGDSFEQLTKANAGKAVAIVLDDFVYSYPTVQGAIAGGKFDISGNFTKSEADDVASLLKASLTGNVRLRIVAEEEKP